MDILPFRRQLTRCLCLLDISRLPFLIIELHVSTIPTHVGMQLLRLTDESSPNHHNLLLIFPNSLIDSLHIINPPERENIAQFSKSFHRQILRRPTGTEQHLRIPKLPPIHRLQFMVLKINACDLGRKVEVNPRFTKVLSIAPLNFLFVLDERLRELCTVDGEVRFL